jgi:hypothetical protein
MKASTPNIWGGQDYFNIEAAAGICRACDATRRDEFAAQLRAAASASEAAVLLKAGAHLATVGDLQDVLKRLVPDPGYDVVAVDVVRNPKRGWTNIVDYEEIARTPAWYAAGGGLVEQFESHDLGGWGSDTGPRSLGFKACDAWLTIEPSDWQDIWIVAPHTSFGDDANALFGGHDELRYFVVQRATKVLAHRPRQLLGGVGGRSLDWTFENGRRLTKASRSDWRAAVVHALPGARR